MSKSIYRRLQDYGFARVYLRGGKWLFETRILPAFFASAIVNSDESGMDDREIRHMNAYLSDMKSNGWNVVGLFDDNEAFFSSFHDARDYVLPCDCLTYLVERKGWK
jgi:hypothetical protein